MEDTVLTLWQVLGALVGTLLVLAVLLWAGRQTVGQARGLWLALRGEIPVLVGAVNEPGDPAVRELARLSHVSPAVWAAFLPAFFEALSAALDQVMGANQQQL